MDSPDFLVYCHIEASLITEQDNHFVRQGSFVYIYVSKLNNNSITAIEGLPHFTRIFVTCSGFRIRPKKSQNLAFTEAFETLTGVSSLRGSENVHKHSSCFQLGAGGSAHNPHAHNKTPIFVQKEQDPSNAGDAGIETDIRTRRLHASGHTPGRRREGIPRN